MAVAWSTTNRVGTAVLSSGNLRVTKTTTNAARGRADLSRSSGKWYWEYVQTVSGTGSTLGTGLVADSLTPLSAGYMGSGNLSVGCWDDAVYYKGASPNAVNCAGNGARIGVAWDADNKRIWFRKNGGLWNNSGTANPATNTGGIDISESGQTSWAPVWFYDSTATTLDSLVNFGASAFTDSVPSGFLAYDGSGGSVAYTLTAAAGAFALTGLATILRATRNFPAASAPFALCGPATILRSARVFAAAQAAFSLAGQTAFLRAARKLVAAASTFNLTGNAAALAKSAGAAKVLQAAAGSFALAGQAAALRAGRKVAAAAAAFVLTRPAASLIRGRRMAAGAGAFALTGVTIGFRRTYVMRAERRAYVLTGQAAELINSHGTVIAYPVAGRTVVAAPPVGALDVVASPPAAPASVIALPV